MIPARAGTHCLAGNASRDLLCRAEAAGSRAAILHGATRGAVQGGKAQLQLDRQFSVVFLLGAFHMPGVSRGRIHACEVLLLSPSLCVILSLSSI